MTLKYMTVMVVLRHLFFVVNIPGHTIARVFIVTVGNALECFMWPYWLIIMNLIIFNWLDVMQGERQTRF